MLKLQTIGSDPEFFIRKKKDGTYMPSSLITSGTKFAPEEAGTKGFLIHKDNLTVEGNIPPSKNKEEFIHSMKFLKNIINTIAEIKGCEIVCEDSVEFKNRFLDLEDAKEFGCSGFFNSWDSQLCEIETPKLETNKRVAGFHLHLGYKFDESKFGMGEIAKAIGRAYDLFVVLPSDEIKYDEFRRNNYGSYGSIRIKSYGVEVRALGSYFANDEYLDWVYDQVIKMFDWLNIEGNIEKILSFDNVGDSDIRSNLYEVKNKLKIEEKVKCTI